MTYSLHWLGDVLRAAGCKVVEQPGWQTRGRAEMGEVRGILCHHTAGPLTGNAPSLGTVQNGRSDLPGPLSQLVLGRDGTFFVVAAGRCNHAGAGSWHGVTTGNSSFIGIEAENAGTGKDPWPAVQMDAYVRGAAAILSHCGLSSEAVAGHKEYAQPKGRKTDPSFDMEQFRAAVEHAMGGLHHIANAATIISTDPKHAMLRTGDSGDSVRLLQQKLGVGVDGSFGPATEAAVKQFQTTHSLTADGLVGPATWAALG